MARLFSNFGDGTLTADIDSVAVTFSSAGLADLPVVSGSDYVYLTLDADGSAGAPEVVKVTAHSAAATSATIVRAQLSTSARAHLAGTDWVAGVYDEDLERLDTIEAAATTEASTRAAADTALDARLDAVEANGWVTAARITAGAVEAAKLASDAVTTVKIADLNVTEGKIASGAVTTAKILDANVTEAKLATDAVTAAKIAAGAVGTSELGATINTSWTPTISQGVSTNVSKTVNEARYIELGPLVICWWDVTISGSGTAGSPIGVSMPVTPNSSHATSVQIGAGMFFDSDGPAIRYTGTVERQSSKFILATSVGLAGEVPSTALAVNDILRGFAIYLK